MFKNHIKIAWRTLLHNKVFSLINIIGLSIGLCAAIVIGAIVYYDFSFDTFHQDKDKIYRVVTEFKSPSFNGTFRGTNLPLMNTLKQGIVGIDVSAPTWNADIEKVRIFEDDNTVFKKPGDIIFTDDDYFQLFRYEWLLGDKQTALSTPGLVVLNKEIAEKFFPNTPLQKIQGKILMYNDSIPLKITGIIEGFKENSDLSFKQFISLSSTTLFGLQDIKTADSWNSTNSNYQLFIKLDKNADLSGIQERLNDIAFAHKNTADWAREDERFFRLQPLSDFHFGEKYDVASPGNSLHKADLKIMKALALVAFFLLLLGCANFINLNSAKALSHAKGIGIRKTLGSSKKQIISQFYYQTLILTSVAAVVSLLLAPLLLFQFKEQLPVGIRIDVLYQWKGLLGIVLLVLLVSLVSGCYPAWVLSNFKPVSVLKGQMVKGTKGTNVRRTLCVFQFMIAQLFIISTLLVGKQLSFVIHSDMGFNAETTAYVNMPLKEDKITLVKKERFFNELKNVNEISDISFGRNPPASRGFWRTMLGYFNKDVEEFIEVEMLLADQNFLNTYDIPIIAGRHRHNDTIKEYVVNETLVKSLGYKNPEDIIGTNLQYVEEDIPVVGVMADFNQRSMHEPISPVVLTGSSSSYFGHIHFNLGNDSHQWSAAINKITKAWHAIYPNEDLEITYMDAKMKEFYNKEQRTIQLLKWATALAISISCLGLFGLVIHSTEKRMKEIGIRKVLGATLAQLNTLLCKEFIWLVGLAFAISVPLSWFGLTKWLENFAFKTSLSWWVFASGGLGMQIIAIIVICIRTLSTAKANPVKSLRTE